MSLTILWVLLILGLAVLAFYTHAIEPFRIKTSRVDIHIPDLDESLDGFTICHLSDTHTKKFGRIEGMLHEELSHISVDLCVVTGDLVRRESGIEPLGSLLSAVNTRLGVFAVPGNGDHKAGVPVNDIVSRLGESGIRVLVNECTTLLTNGARVHIMGVDDPFCGHDDICLAVDGLSRGGIELLLAHSPDIACRLGRERPHLILAGHTHGGQFRMPFYGAISCHSRYGLSISDGLFDDRELSAKAGRELPGVRMYVSRGLTGSGVWARFLSPPEIALITLRREFGNPEGAVH